MDLKEVEKESASIREQYHKLEELYHGSRWSLEEDERILDLWAVGSWTMKVAGRVMSVRSCLPK